MAEVVIDTLAPIRKRYLELIEDSTELDRLLAVGVGRAGERAEAKLSEMKRRMGLLDGA